MSRYATTLRTAKVLLIMALFISMWPSLLTSVRAVPTITTLVGSNSLGPTGLPSGGAGFKVTFTGGGFSTTDAACAVSGSAVSNRNPPTCSVDGLGGVSGYFYVAYVDPGQYPITVSCTASCPIGGEFAQATFTVTLTLTPSGGTLPAVTLSGTAFLAADTSCSVSSTTPGLITGQTCSVIGGIVSGSFIVGNAPPNNYVVRVTGSTGDFAEVILPLTLVLTPTIGGAWFTVTFTDTGFLGDIACTVSNSAVTGSNCSVDGAGKVSGSFVAACFAPGRYLTIVTGSPGGDFTLGVFTVTLTFAPCSSGIGSEIAFTGLPFPSSPTACSVSSIAIPGSPPGPALYSPDIITGYPTKPGPACTIDVNGAVIGYFVVGKVSAGKYGIRVSGILSGGIPSGDYWDAIFTVMDVDLNVSPGKYDLKLRDYFPNFGYTSPSFGQVKLSYPNSAILTNSTGDLLFNVTLTSHSYNDFLGADCSSLLSACPQATLYASFDIYIPPDFTGITTQNVWTSFTNNYDTSLSLSVSKVSSSDPVAPGWWDIKIYTLRVIANFNYPLDHHDLTANRVFMANQAQYVRVFQVTSPTTAGRYFFKAFVNGTSPIGTARYPTLVVKASRDPAHISGVLRNLGNVDPRRAGQPINLTRDYGARILATGKDLLGNNVAAQTFINWAANGAYTLFGVAPGSYNITAYAAGFVPTTMPTQVSVLALQSLAGADIYMPESVKVTGTVLSESSNGGLLCWNGVVPTDPLCNIGIITSLNLPISIKLLNLDGSVAASTPSPYIVSLRIPNNVPNPSPTQFDFSIQREVGFDGRIPQDYANYTSGLTAGDYLLRAYVSRYVQFEDVYVHVTNQTLRTMSVIPLIRTGSFLVTVHFMNSNGTIRPDLSDPSINGTPLNGILTVNAYDQAGVLRGQSAQAQVPAGSTSATVEVFGFSQRGQRGIQSLFQADYGLMPTTYHFLATFTSSPSFAGFANIGIRTLYYQIQDVQATIGLATGGVVLISLPMYKGGGILLTLRSIDDQTPSIIRPWAHPGASITLQIVDPTGKISQTNTTQPFGDTVSFYYAGLLTNAYTVIVQTVGYTQRQILNLHVVLCSNSDASIWMIQNPEIDLTLTFKNEGLLTLINSTQPYAQPINHLDATPIRLELFDERGNFVAANNTYIPNLSLNPNCACFLPTTTRDFHLAGFRRYFGDPRFVWSGFYDTTDASQQNDGGILPGTYVLRFWVDGYYQSTSIKVTLPEQTFGRKEVSIVNSVYRASRIHGTVLGPDLYDKARPLSWATVALEPRTFKTLNWGNFTTYTLDGKFQVWAPPGTYNAGISLKGYTSYAGRVEVSPGADINMWVWMESG